MKANMWLYVMIAWFWFNFVLNGLYIIIFNSKDKE